eukprot:CAMPEP_0194161974 /NCGR_PEP_ID=MMETSP0152-20130528/79244_1 /TAXON_ID=1049557 /ORGANISM="Thalassiothrix antarctica, Strain L6-D1" /LENGTH=521 /DNA_ID=CAMNT_0038871833 /DNA_START=396 /DNA_END=1961 /DNA_ORIENTATION=+
MRRNNFFNLNDDESINEDYPGLAGVLMDELARRANFTWRDSFVMLDRPVDGRSFTDLLEWTTLTYDLSVNWWTWTSERRSLGIDFPIPWYDASIMIVGKKDKDANKDKFDILSIFAPFDLGVWLMIVLTMITSGLLYFFMEVMDPATDRSQLQFNPLSSIFLASFAFTGHFSFEPRTMPARLFGFSLTFLALIIGSAYTANLASFLVVKNTPKLEIQSLKHAVSLGMKLCTYKDTAEEKMVLDAFPQANMDRKSTEQQSFWGVHGIVPEVASLTTTASYIDDTDLCDFAITSYSSWRFWSQNQDTNPGCRLGWVGRKFNDVPAGFATLHDSGDYCTSFINDVLNLHLDEMRSSNFIDMAWKNHIVRTATTEQECQDTPPPPKKAGNPTDLKLKNLGGIFIIHFIFCFITLLMTISNKYLKMFSCHRNKNNKKTKNTQENNDGKAPIEERKTDGDINDDVLKAFYDQTESEQFRIIQRINNNDKFEEFIRDSSSRQSHLEKQMSLVIELLKDKNENNESVSC